MGRCQMTTSNPLHQSKPTKFLHKTGRNKKKQKWWADDAVALVASFLGYHQHVTTSLFFLIFDFPTSHRFWKFQLNNQNFSEVPKNQIINYTRTGFIYICILYIYIYITLLQDGLYRFPLPQTERGKKTKKTYKIDKTQNLSPVFSSYESRLKSSTVDILLRLFVTKIYRTNSVYFKLKFCFLSPSFYIIIIFISNIFKLEKYTNFNIYLRNN